MSEWYIINDNGEVVQEPDLLKAAKWYETAERSIARTTVGDTEVSTVFLALDHRHGEGAPLLWETMTNEGGGWDNEVRYTSKAAALLGHEETVARLKEPTP